MKKNVLLLIMIAVLFMAFLGVSCSKASDSKTFSIGEGIKASLVDDGNYGYVLRIEGKGEIDPFKSPKDAPWYGISGRIKALEVPDGITSIGANCFAECTYLKSAVLPASVVSIGENAFNPNTAVCVYGDVKTSGKQSVYVYSEEKPTDGGMYWHFSGEKEVLWDMVRILFIGNSFTYYNDMPDVVAKLASMAGLNVKVDSVTAGAYTLTKFADPNDANGSRVLETLNARDDYDIVVLQDQSTRPINSFDLFREGAASLVQLVKRTQKDCRIYLYQTWGFPEGANGDIPKMEQALFDAYSSVAGELGLGLVPVGRAFTKVLLEHPEIGLYNADGRHPSPEGSFLSACVQVSRLLDVDPRGLKVEGFSFQDVLSDAAYAVLH